MKTYKRGSSLRPKGKRGFAAFVNKVTVFDAVCLTIAGISSIVSLATVVFLW